MKNQATPKASLNENLGFDRLSASLAAELQPNLVEVMQQSEMLVGMMRTFFAKIDRCRSEEFLTISSYIKKARDDIRELRPHDIAEDRIPSAGAELDAITKDTESATNAIMTCAETIMSLDPGDDLSAYKASVDDEVMKIFEACSFQDITGQRVSKVVTVLRQIEERVGKLAETLGVEDKEAVLSEAEIRRRDLFLNGPAIGGPEVKQNAIDALFDFDSENENEEDLKRALADAQSQAVADVKDVDKNPAQAKSKSKIPVVEAVPVVEASTQQSQDDIDALFNNLDDSDFGNLEAGKAVSQDDIDALFD
jgi:chemotaxis regulatin CheY-phosphate phosphatase CheZ